MSNEIEISFCNIHKDYVETIKQWFCKSCMQFLCDDCYQNRRNHECILESE